VVPTVRDEGDWNRVHEARKELADGDWGVELRDTPFARPIEGEVK
jgi:hypothetical protein